MAGVGGGMLAVCKQGMVLERKKEVRGDEVDVGVHICVAHRPSK